jgi:hypothetical protein
LSLKTYQSLSRLRHPSICMEPEVSLPCWKEPAIILSRIRGSVPNNNGFWIGWLDLLTLVHTTRTYSQYSATADLHNLQFTVAHALGFSGSTSRILVTDLNTETITSNHYEVFLPFLVQSPWTADSPELDPILPVQSHLAISGLSLYRRGMDHIGNTSSVARIVMLPANEL